MNVAIALFILMGAMTFGVSQQAVNEVPLKPLENEVIQALPKIAEKNVIVCHQHDAEFIERDLTSLSIGGDLVNE